MNVVTANENKAIIDRLTIDIIKRIDGQFELRELLSQFVNMYFNKMIIDITSIKDYENIEVIRKLSRAIDPNRVILLLGDNMTVNSSVYQSQLVEIGFYNFTRNFEGLMFLYDKPNTKEDVNHFLLTEEKKTELENLSIEPQVNIHETNERKIIGLENLTLHAGASSLTNMMVRQLNNKGYQAIGVEMFKQDLIFYHESSLHACMNKNDLERLLREQSGAEVVIIDVNEFGEAEKFCDEILYLVEPSYVKMTKLLKKNKNAFLDHKGDTIVLNMSFVSDNEVGDFEYETKCKVFANIPPLNDRDKDLKEINELLQKLGFLRVSSE